MTELSPDDPNRMEGFLRTPEEDAVLLVLPSVVKQERHNKRHELTTKEGRKTHHTTLKTSVQTKLLWYDFVRKRGQVRTLNRPLKKFQEKLQFRTRITSKARFYNFQPQPKNSWASSKIEVILSKH